LDYLAEVAEWVRADTITIQGGGAYGAKAAARGRCASISNTFPQPCARA
jgi:hypothetical protein